MLQFAMPLLGAFLAGIKDNKREIAEQAGVTGSVVEKVGNAFVQYAQKDERMLKQVAFEIEQAREHDAKTQIRDVWLVNLTRGLVRPIITFSAMSWYIYARLNNVPMQPEDYTIVGGILAFWFGFRPFEKRK